MSTKWSKKDQNPEKREENTETEKNSRSWVDGILWAVIPAVIVLILFKVVFSIYYIPSPSMEPTLNSNSVHIGWRLPYLLSDPEPERGDIVVFYHAETDKRLVKRVIGIGGDVVRIEGGIVYLNGEKLDEPYLADSPFDNEDVTYIVPEGKFLALGDNRNHSADARFWLNPYIDISEIQCKITP